MLNGLDLFSGIGGISLALRPWVRTVAYCEIDRYCQSLLLSKMQRGDIDEAPICDDVRSLNADMLPRIDIILGGFPCQDISTAGRGAGLEGERSGLFFQVMRLVQEVKPTFVFLENVPAIRTRGAERVGKELACRGYDCRWDVISAAEMGAPHLRKRWFLLAAHTERFKRWDESRGSSRQSGEDTPKSRDNGEKESLAKPMCEGLEGLTRPKISGRDISGPVKAGTSSIFNRQHWTLEPDVGRVANGIPFRVDRLRGLGNAVVPAQAREAFMRLGGLK